MNSPSLTKEPVTYWYREPWPWFIIGVIMITFAWGSVQLFVAFTNADEVVVDDYYKVGKAINQDLSRDRRAREMGIGATVTIERNTLQAELSGQIENWPQQLRLRLIPVARNIEPQTIPMLQTAASENAYRGQLSQIPEGRYYLQLETLDVLVPEQGYASGWRLNREVSFAPGTAVTLQAGD